MSEKSITFAYMKANIPTGTRPVKHITFLAKNMLKVEEDSVRYYFRVYVRPHSLGQDTTVRDEIRLGVYLTRAQARAIHDYYSTLPADLPDRYSYERMNDAFPQLFLPISMEVDDAVLEYYVSEDWADGIIDIEDRMREAFEVDIRYSNFLPDGATPIEALPMDQREAVIQRYLHYDAGYRQWHEQEYAKCANDPSYLIERYGADELVELSDDDSTCLIPEEIIDLK